VNQKVKANFKRVDTRPKQLGAFLPGAAVSKITGSLDGNQNGLKMAGDQAGRPEERGTWGCSAVVLLAGGARKFSLK